MKRHKSSTVLIKIRRVKVFYISLEESWKVAANFKHKSWKVCKKLRTSETPQRVWNTFQDALNKSPKVLIWKSPNKTWMSLNRIHIKAVSFKVWNTFRCELTNSETSPRISYTSFEKFWKTPGEVFNTSKIPSSVWKKFETMLGLKNA